MYLLIFIQDVPEGTTFVEVQDNDQLVNELFKSFESPDDPTFLSSPENDYGFNITPPSDYTSSPPSDFPPSEFMGPPSSANDLYPRLGKKQKGNSGVDIEKWTPYHPSTRQYYRLFDATQLEMYEYLPLSFIYS